MNNIKYFDHAATTGVSKEVFKEMLPFFSTEYGNPSSIYGVGRRAKRAIEEAREKVAKAINAHPKEIYFTGCGSESDNIAIKGIARANRVKGNHIITSKIEHHAVLNSCKTLEQEGFNVTYLNVDKNGRILLKELENLENIEAQGIFTHFATSDVDLDYTKHQIEEFEKAIQKITKHIKNIKYIHCGNSSAVIQIKDLPGNMIRPGIMLYGYLPDESLKGKVNLKPSCVLKSKISFIKEVEKDTSISYGRTFITKRKSVIANVPIGYADGIRRSLSNNGYVIVDGMKAPIVGRVCMDSFMIDVTDVPNVKIGDEIFIWDNDKITLDEIAKQCGTINYEILSTISNRVVREIV